MIRRGVVNAFTRSATGARNPRQSLAGSLAAMQARLEPRPHGHRLSLRPMLAVDAVQALLRSDPEGGEPRWNVLLAMSADEGEPVPVASLARRFGLGLEETDGPALVLDDSTLLAMASLLPLSSLRLARIAGPVERRDVAALVRAVGRDRSPLEVELRATAALDVGEDDLVVLDVRDPGIAYGMVAENFRHYLSALCDRPVEGFAGPEIGLIAALLDHEGLTVQPIETEVFSTFIDVGICPTADAPQRPASRSLIYDRPSNTWHGE